MNCRLSKTKIESFAGNVIPLRLCGGEEYGNEEIHWECTSSCIGLRTFAGEANGGFSDGVLLTLLSEGEGVVTAALDGVVYRCIWDTINPVYHPLADLVGLYVEKVEEI